MDEAVSIQVRDEDGVALLDVSGASLAQLAQVLEEILNRDQRPVGVVLAGDFETFDENRWSDNDSAEALFSHVTQVQSVLRRLETTLPVVVASTGSILDSGLALALHAHRRIAVTGAYRVGTTDLSVGLMLGFGGSVRLTRLVGVVSAVDEVLLASPRALSEALALGLINEIVADGAELLQRALWHVRELARRESKQPWDAPGYTLPGGALNSQVVTQALGALPSKIREQLRGEPVFAVHSTASVVAEGAAVDIETADRLESRYYVASLRSADHARLGMVRRAAEALGLALRPRSTGSCWPPTIVADGSLPVAVTEVAIPRVKAAFDNAVRREVSNGLSVIAVSRALAMVGCQRRISSDTAATGPVHVVTPADLEGVQERVLGAVSDLAQELVADGMDPQVLDVASIIAGAFPVRLGGAWTARNLSDLQENGGSR